MKEYVDTERICSRCKQEKRNSSKNNRLNIEWRAYRASVAA